jgi:hypothetical protein
VAGAGEAFVDTRTVQQFQPRRAGDRGGGGGRMMPSSACARASATSTSSQACQRFSRR